MTTTKYIFHGLRQPKKGEKATCQCGEVFEGSGNRPVDAFLTHVYAVNATTRWVETVIVKEEGGE